MGILSLLKNGSECFRAVLDGGCVLCKRLGRGMSTSAVEVTTRRAMSKRLVLFRDMQRRI